VRRPYPGHFDFEGVTTYSVIAGPDGLFEYTYRLLKPGTIITAVSDAAGNIAVSNSITI
jgi:hypothetical protein